MKVKFNRNVRHDGVDYVKDHVYEFEGDLTDDLQALLDHMHEDVHTQKSESEEEHRETVHVAEAAPDDAKADPTPKPNAKTPSVHKEG